MQDVCLWHKSTATKKKIVGRRKGCAACFTCNITSGGGGGEGSSPILVSLASLYLYLSPTLSKFHARDRYCCRLSYMLQELGPLPPAISAGLALARSTLADVGLASPPPVLTQVPSGPESGQVPPKTSNIYSTGSLVLLGGYSLSH
jgi:hypothetical protein